MACPRLEGEGGILTAARSFLLEGFALGILLLLLQIHKVDVELDGFHGIRVVDLQGVAFIIHMHLDSGDVIE